MFIVITFVCIANSSCIFLEPIKSQPTYEACVQEANEVMNEARKHPEVKQAYNTCIKVMQKP